jgi:UDP-N-acetylmuramate: L-alanyl-gamma-D-glutamyl-meso-diaminopimelate ligase
MDDFGHHPTAVAATLEGLRARMGGAGRLVAVLRPASATACRALHQHEWAEALARADEAVVAPLARTKIAPAERLDLEKLARDIARGGGRASLARSLDDIPGLVVDAARRGDTVVFFSNTDPGSLIDETLSALAAHANGG